MLLRVEDLVVEFHAEGGKVKAVSGISLDLVAGETLGLVGESGCGKSTTGRAVMQLPRPTSGTVRFDGVELTALKGDELRKTRPQLQMIFQDPISSLNPRRKVGDIVAEGLEIWQIGDGASRAAKVDEMLAAVGLDPETARDRRPHEFSGGQCQRISIARAVITDPKVIICDEPVSALDVSVQAQILNLLEEMKQRYNLTMLFIAHDLAVVKNVSDRVAVMYLGKLCEVGAPDVLYAQPAHPYTAALLAAIPVPDPGSPPDDARVLGGEIPSNLNPPSGCRFRTRCPKAQDRCAEEEPQIRNVGARPVRGLPLPARARRGHRVRRRVSVGRLVAIFVAPTAGAPMEAHDRIGVAAGAGLDGDRYAIGTGTYSGTGRGPRDVTLIERESVDAVRRADDGGVDVREDETRRNLVTEGVALNHLVGRTFRVGAVRMRGVRLAEPCVYLEQLTGLIGVRAALVHRGGLRAEVLDDGELRVGDEVSY